MVDKEIKIPTQFIIFNDRLFNEFNQNKDSYIKLLEKYNFVKKSSLNNMGFEKTALNKEITIWVGERLENILSNNIDNNLNIDFILIPKRAIDYIFASYASSVGNNNFEHWEFSSLFSRYNSKELFPETIKSFKKSEFGEKGSFYLNHIGLNSNLTIYSKLDLIFLNEYLNNQFEIKGLDSLFNEQFDAQIIYSNKENKKHNDNLKSEKTKIEQIHKTSEETKVDHNQGINSFESKISMIYDKYNLSEYNTGNKIDVNSYIKRKELLRVDLNPKFREFILSEKGKKLLNHSGKATERLLNYLAITYDVIQKEF